MYTEIARHHKNTVIIDNTNSLCEEKTSTLSVEQDTMSLGLGSLPVFGGVAIFELAAYKRGSMR